MIPPFFSKKARSKDPKPVANQKSSYSQSQIRSIEIWIKNSTQIQDILYCLKNQLTLNKIVRFVLFMTLKIERTRFWEKSQ